MLNVISVERIFYYIKKSLFTILIHVALNFNVTMHWKCKINKQITDVEEMRLITITTLTGARYFSHSILYSSLTVLDSLSSCNKPNTRNENSLSRTKIFNRRDTKVFNWLGLWFICFGLVQYFFVLIPIGAHF